MANKKVLIVDDEIHIVHVVSIKLRNNGYDVISASNGAEAYELACKEEPDIIVTDCQMPVMNGLEFVRMMRSRDSLKQTPVILLTARSFAVSADEQRSLEISDCLSKPFSPKELLKDIQDILHQREVAVQS